MSIVPFFYNATIKKYIAIFGTTFKDISIMRDDELGYSIKSMIVPISYGPYQKTLARVEQDPELNQKTAITLPRMAFEMVNIAYDPPRKVGSHKKHFYTGGGIQYTGAPYNIEFNLYIMTKYSEDGVQIIEQILPFFKPERTTTVFLIDGMSPLDIPLILNSVSSEDSYEGDFITRRSVVWTLSFTMKAWFMGPTRDRSRIKFMDVRTYDGVGPKAVGASNIITQVGLTEDGTPTSHIEDSVPYEQIEIDDDWGVITYIKDFTDEEDSTDA